MSNKELDLRRQIMFECLNQKGNFQDIGMLIQYEDDYYTARDGRYDFSHCPQSFDIFEHCDIVELCCTQNDYESTAAECEACWKAAFEHYLNKKEN